MRRILFLLALALYVALPAEASLTLRQSTSATVKLGPFIDSSGAPQNGLTIANTDVRVSANGATGANKNSGGCTNDASMSAYYTCTFNSTDTATVGTLQVSVIVSGALPVYEEFQVIPQATYDITYASAATGLVPANVTQLGGSSTAGNTFKAAFDGTATGARLFGIDRLGTAASVATGTLTLDAGASYGDNTLVGATVWGCGSTQGYCQANTVASNVGSTDVLTLQNNWAVTPSGTVTYYLFGTAASSGGGGGGATAAEIWSYSDRQLTALDEDATTMDLNATAVGSVAGAVGSVTGNVGGNVVGTVASVAGNVSGNVVGSVGSVATNGITANSLAADAGTELATATWANATRTLSAGTNIVLAKGTGITGFNDPTVGAIADAVWDEVLSGHTTAGTTGAALSAASTGGLDPTQIRDALGMASANLDTQLSTINTNVVGLDGGMNWNPAWDGEVQSEVADALNALAITEPSGKPAWGGTPWEWLAWIGAWTRNEIQQTSSQKILRNDANNSNLATCAVTDNGTTLIVAECSP